MPTASLDDLGHLPTLPSPEARRAGIGVVGAGFIVRDCHLVAYAEAGFRVVGIASRSGESAREVATLAGDPRGVRLAGGACSIAPRSRSSTWPSRRRRSRRSSGRIARHPRKVRGILAQKPLALSLEDAKGAVSACRRAGIALQVNQNMRYDHSVRALKTLLDRGTLGDPVLATIEMRRHPPLDALGRGGAFALDVHHEHPPPRHLPLLAGGPGARARQHEARPPHGLRPLRRDQPLHPRI